MKTTRRIVYGRSTFLTVALVLLSSLVLVGVALTPAIADVSSVNGSSYGYFSRVSLFDGPYGDRGPRPTVSLAADASNSPQDASVADAEARYGPAVLFRSGRIDVHAEARLGADGFVTTSSNVQGHPSRQERPGPFLFDAVNGGCTADDTGVTSAVTITNGVVETKYDRDGNPTQTQPVPTNPAPGFTIEGTLDHVGDRFRIVFNEQVVAADGSLTVYAAHMYLLGPTAKGDLFIARSVCGATAAGGTTTTSTSGTTTTSVPGTTTTTPGTTTTTTSTTVPGTTTSTTTSSVPGDGPAPPKGHSEPRGGDRDERQAARAPTPREVAGGAYGYWTEVSLFGGPASERGPAPAVTLAPDASNSPQDDSVGSAEAIYGPAVLFESGRIQVHTEGSVGTDAYVSSSSQVQGHPAEGQRPGPLLYDELESTCRADDSGVSSSVTFTNGVVETKYDENSQEAIATKKIPTNPPPGYTIEGTLDHVGDRFRIVFNEQQKTAGGVLVNAAHMYLLGPIAKGDLVIGQTRCAVGRAGTLASASAGPEGFGAGGAGNGARLANTGGELLPSLAAALALLVAGTACVARGAALARLSVRGHERPAPARRMRRRRYRTAEGRP